MNTSTRTKHKLVFASVILLLTTVACDAEESVTIEIVGNTHPEVRVIKIEVIPQNNCGGTAEVENEIEKSRSIAHTIEVGEELEVNANGQIGFAGTDVELGATVATQFGYSYGSVENLSRSITVKAKEGTYMEHQVKLQELWEIGTAKVVVSGQELEVPFSFRTDFAVELVESKEIKNKCLTPTLTGTPKPMQPTPTPTNTPEYVQEPATVCNTPLVILDDFSRSSPDAAVWMTGDTASGSYAVSDGKLVFTAENTTDKWQVRALALQLRQDYRAVEATFTLRDVANGKGSIGFGGVFGDEAYDYRFLYRLWTDAAAPGTESLIGWEVTEGSQIVVSKNSALHFPEFPTTHTLRVAVEQDSLTFCVDGRLEDVITVPQTSAKYGRWIQLEYHLESGASIKAIVDDVQIQYAY